MNIETTSISASIPKARGKPKVKESTIQAAVIARLTLRGWAVVRMNSSTLALNYKGKTRYLNAYTIIDTGKSAGFPDLLAMKDGKFITVETKTENGELSESQIEFEQYAKRKGIPFFVVRSGEEMDEVLKML